MTMQEFGQYQKELHRNIECPNTYLRARAVNELQNSLHISIMHQKIENLPTQDNKIVSDWHLFSAGTNISDIQDWFTETFHVTF